MPIKAVVFDCFGVLVTEGWSPFLHRHFHDKPDLRERVADSGRMVDAGLKDYQEHIAELASITGLAQAAIHRQINTNHPNSELFEYIKSLKPHYKIGMLSNAGDNHLERLFEPWQRELIDGAVLSYEVGVTKPDPLMYETIAARLEVAMEECVFIDDIERYCEAAKELGMQAVQYRATSQTIQMLTEQLNA